MRVAKGRQKLRVFRIQLVGSFQYFQRLVDHCDILSHGTIAIQRDAETFLKLKVLRIAVSFRDLCVDLLVR